MAATHRPTIRDSHTWGELSLPEHPVHNRIGAVMVHIPWYTFEGQARLAADVGVSRSTISRLLRGKSKPSYALVERVVAALETRLKRPLPARELLSLDGTYPTPSACTLCGCGGCLPDHFYTANDALKPAYRNMRPGEWSLSPAAASPTVSTPPSLAED